MSDYVANWVIRQRGAKVDETTETTGHASQPPMGPPCCEALSGVRFTGEGPKWFYRCPDCGVVTTLARVA